MFTESMNILKSKLLTPLLSASILLITSALIFTAKKSVVFLELKVAQVNSSQWNIILMVDPTAAVFAASVALIAAAVLTFSASYMAGQPRVIGFYTLVNLFILSMFLLLASPSLLSGLVGWDALGMVSFLLVIFYGSAKAFNSGIITALSNRLGDLFIISGLSIVIMKGAPELKFITLLEAPAWVFLALAIATTTKSAQIPFSAWLPAAMAAPTPVSALVHSSTLVTAGVYLMIRHSEVTLGAQAYLVVAGVVTSWLAGTMALVEPDLKKIVALSTLSQLGVMMTMIGINMKVLALTHLLAHAFFKAMIFIATGSVIHSNSAYQDVRWASQFATAHAAKAAFLVASVSLCGVPFMSAFFSKEALVEFMLMSSHSFALGGAFILSIFLTSAYSARLISLLFLKAPALEVTTFRADRDVLTTLALSLLLLPAAVGGWAIAPALGASTLGESTIALKLLTLALIFTGLVMAALQVSSTSALSMWGLGAVTRLPQFLQLPVPLLLKTVDRGLLVNLAPSPSGPLATGVATPGGLGKLSLLSLALLAALLHY